MKSYKPKTTKECLFLIDKGYLLSNIHGIITCKIEGRVYNSSVKRESRPYKFTNPKYWRVLGTLSILDKVRIKLKLI
mgnify:CR=1 FL=1